MTSKSVVNPATTPSGLALLRASRPVRTAEELRERLQTDPWLAEEIKKDPEAAIAAVTGPPLAWDQWIYRMVVGALGLAVLIALIGAIMLALKNLESPDVLTALGSAAVGALAGLLAPSPVGRANG